MKVRYYTEPENQEPHLHRHGVSKVEAEEVLGRPLWSRPTTSGQKQNGRCNVGVERKNEQEQFPRGLGRRTCSPRP